MPHFDKTYRIDKQGNRVDGTFLLAFIHNGDYHLDALKIYSDGVIDCWELVEFEEFKEKVRSGWVVTRPPKKARMSLGIRGQFTAIDGAFWPDPEEFIKEVADEIDELNGRPTSSDRCREAWERYEASPSELSKEQLRLAYSAVPAHLRRFVLRDQDAKDGPILAVLENWPEFD